jgi:4-amino-4-deoxychorismate lyase
MDDNPSYVFWKGRCLPEDQAFVSVNDRGFLFGDGVFSTIKVHNGVVEAYYPHVGRLLKQCEELQIIPPNISEDWVKQLLIQNNALKGTWRMKMIVSGGESPLLTLEKRTSSGLLMTIRPYQPPSHSLKLGITDHTFATPLAHLKTLSYLDRLFIKSVAAKKECDDCLIKTSEGIILEAGSANIFWRHKEHIYVPCPTLPYLQGISLQFCIKAFSQMDLEVRYCKLPVEKLNHSTQLFACNALMGPQSVAFLETLPLRIDETFTRTLREEYQSLISSVSLRVVA